MLANLFNKAKKRDLLLEVKDWHFDRYQSALVQRNFLLLITAASLLGVALSVFAISEVVSNKSIEPFVIEVNKKSGITTVVDPLSIREYSANQAVSNFFLLDYIKMRETEIVNLKNVSEVTENVSYLSSKSVRNEFYSYIRTSNPESPLVLYGSDAVLDLKIKSVQYLSPTSVQIRFATEAIYSSGSKIRKNKIARVDFEYSSLKMSKKAREKNPLGFLVTSYRVDDEYYE